MGKVVRLTERDLNRLIKKVIKQGVVITAYAANIPADGQKGTWVTKDNELFIYDSTGKHIHTYGPEGIK